MFSIKFGTVISWLSAGQLSARPLGLLFVQPIYLSSVYYVFMVIPHPGSSHICLFENDLFRQLQVDNMRWAKAEALLACHI
jgi:hypothetical protein